MKVPVSTVVVCLAAGLSGCAGEAGIVGSFLPTLTLQPLYADTNTDALIGARGASYRKGANKERGPTDDSAHNACFARSDQAAPGTFIAACRIAANSDDEAGDVRRYFLAGISLSDQICQQYLNRLAVRETGYGGLSDTISQGGAAATTIMAATAASNRVTGIIGSLFQLGGGLSSVARERLSLAASTESVYALINDTRALKRSTILVNEPVDFWSAYRVLDEYHRTCSYTAIRQAINAAVAGGARTAAEQDAKALETQRNHFVELIKLAGFDVTSNEATLDRVAALYAATMNTKLNLSPTIMALIEDMPRTSLAAKKDQAGSSPAAGVPAAATKPSNVDWLYSSEGQSKLTLFRRAAFESSQLLEIARQSVALQTVQLAARETLVTIVPPAPTIAPTAVIAPVPGASIVPVDPIAGATKTDDGPPT